MNQMITSCSLRDCTTAVDNAANILNGFPSHVASKDQLKASTLSLSAMQGMDPQPPHRRVMGAAASVSNDHLGKKKPTSLKPVLISRHDPYSHSLLHSPYTPADSFLASYSDVGLSNAVDSSFSSLAHAYKSITPLSDSQDASSPSLSSPPGASPLHSTNSCYGVWSPTPIAPTKGVADIIPGHHANMAPSFNAASRISAASLSLAANVFSEPQRSPNYQEFGNRSTSTIVSYTVDRSKGRPIPVRKVA